MTKNMGRAGWRPVRSEVRGEAAEEGAEMLRAVGEEDEAASGVDDRVFASSAKSFRLEGTAENPAAAAKRFSLPERIPYCVSAEPFAIVAAGEAVPAEIGVVSPREDASESRRQKRWEGEPGGGTRRSAARRETALRRPGAGPVRDEPAETGEEVKLLAGVPAAGAFYVYSFDGRLLAEYDVSGVLVRDYVYFGGQLIAEYRNAGAQLLYYASDQISSTRIVTDGSGTVVYAAAHEPYGGIQKTWVTTYDPSLKFSGKQRDPESELDYFGARYYDRSLYRFISTDPIHIVNPASFNPQLFNLYSYSKGNPISYVDPNGMYPVYITVTRTGITPAGGIMGEFAVQTPWQSLSGYTLEAPFLGLEEAMTRDSGSSILPGDYYGQLEQRLINGQNVDTIVLYNSSLLGNRTGICMHGGNTSGQSLGCILVGFGLNSSTGYLSNSARQEIFDAAAYYETGVPSEVIMVLGAFSSLYSASDFPEIVISISYAPSFLNFLFFPILAAI